MSISGGEESYRWNLSQMAKAFNLHRDTIRSRLNDAGVKPCGKKANAPTYHLREAAEAIFAGTTIAGDQADPTKLDPKSRKEWYQSENERLKFQVAIKELITEGDHRENAAKTLKGVASFFDSLPDRMERARIFNPEQLEALERECDRLRNQLYEELREVQD
ncbi:hypothetical protein [Aeromonas phage 32]|nr:hypothetical protein [Aeromonas phage 32]